MATCIDCNREMSIAAGCNVSALTIDGAMYLRRRCTRRRCDDCGARAKHFHHLGCDQEWCPRCGNQLITCGCWTDDPGESDDDE